MPYTLGTEHLGFTPHGGLQKWLKASLHLRNLGISLVKAILKLLLQVAVNGLIIGLLASLRSVKHSVSLSTKHQVSHKPPSE